MKRFLAVISAAICAIACVACGPDSVPKPALLGFEELLAEYADRPADIMIGAHGAPAATEENYALAREMGLTHLFVDACTDAELAAAEKTGLKLIVGMNNIIDTPNPRVDWSVDWSDEKYAPVEMVNYFDEPDIAQFDLIAGWLERHNAKYAASNGADPLFWCNLRPMDMYAYPTLDEEYVRTYCEKVLSRVNGDRMLSFDLYPLRQQWASNADGELSVTREYLADEWLRSLELVGKYGEQTHARTHAYFQTCGFWVPHDNGWTCRRATEEDLRLQAYVCMAFGIRNFTHFTYTTSVGLMNSHGYTVAVLDAQGKPTALYDGAKAVDDEIAELSRYLSAFVRTGTMTVAAGAEPKAFSMLLESVDSLASISEIRVSADTVIGGYRDDVRDHDALLLANYTPTTDRVADEISFALNDGRGLAVFRRGQWSQVRAIGGRVTVQLAPGEGAFAIVLR